MFTIASRKRQECVLENAGISWAAQIIRTGRGATKAIMDPMLGMKLSRNVITPQTNAIRTPQAMKVNITASPVIKEISDFSTMSVDTIGARN